MACVMLLSGAWAGIRKSMQHNIQIQVTFIQQAVFHSKESVMSSEQKPAVATGMHGELAATSVLNRQYVFFQCIRPQDKEI
jgi:hypothetical protein